MRDGQLTTKPMSLHRLCVSIFACAVLSSIGITEERDAQGAEYYCDAYEAEATKDDPVAIRNLAYCYWNGDGREKDLEKAEALLRASASHGNATAMYDLGTLLVFEDSRDDNDDEGIEFLLSSIENGYGRAAYQLGLLHWSGFAGQEMNSELALEHFKKAAEYDSPQAEFLLFCIYKLGLRDVPENAELSEEYYSQLKTTAQRRFIGDVVKVREAFLNDERFLRFAITEEERLKIATLAL